MYTELRWWAWTVCRFPKCMPRPVVVGHGRSVDTSYSCPRTNRPLRRRGTPVHQINTQVQTVRSGGGEHRYMDFRNLLLGIQLSFISALHERSLKLKIQSTTCPVIRHHAPWNGSDDNLIPIGTYIRRPTWIGPRLCWMVPVFLIVFSVSSTCFGVTGSPTQHAEAIYDIPGITPYLPSTSPLQHHLNTPNKNMATSPDTRKTVLITG